jgi:hypothetical protein
MDRLEAEIAHGHRVPVRVDEADRQLAAAALGGAPFFLLQEAAVFFNDFP